MTSTMISELEQVVSVVDLDPALRAMIVTGPIGRTVSRFMWQDHLATLHERIHSSRKPWIAAVNGPAGGGGFALSLPTDIRFTSTEAGYGTQGGGRRPAGFR